jgi:hypothetical protein
MTSATTLRLRKELTSALEALQSTRDQVAQLEGRLETINAIHAEERQRQYQQFQVERKRYEDQLTQLRTANNRLFERRDVESMTRPQLVSLIEQAINEARRKGMTEAEGLLSRHRELTNTTDLELMRGIVKTYQDRISAAEHEAEVAKLKAAPVKLDTRPLSEKLQPAGVPPTGTSIKNSSAFQPPGWWRVGYAPQIDRLPELSVNPPAKSAATPSDFRTFDEKALRIQAQPKYDAFTDYTRLTVPGTKGGTYILSRTGSVFRCSCPAWTFSPLPAEKRTCKHLKGHFGAAAEAQRVANAVPPPSSSTHCWCGAQLTRGQCPEHTRDWKGEELCDCGRKFASCKAAYHTISVAQRAKGHQPKLARSTGMRW